MRRAAWGAVAAAGLVGALAAGCGDVREVAVQDLRQIAVVSRDMNGPIIYYSPDLCVRVGRLVCAFERVHAKMLATRGNVPRQNPADPYNTGWITPREILEADCRATADLRGQARAAVEAAAEFYQRQGDARLALNYPMGAQRAAQILECLERY